ncbi:hypothetical protein DL96DRAFT_1715552 [Flagelloscypha sp. PMI_526]|nr:hypothetical protein DL96DRAFT_1715552 [Flagelloscypha sp. PMI_526]
MVELREAQSSLAQLVTPSRPAGAPANALINNANGHATPPSPPNQSPPPQFSTSNGTSPRIVI